MGYSRYKRHSWQSTQPGPVRIVPRQVFKADLKSQFKIKSGMGRLFSDQKFITKSVIPRNQVKLGVVVCTCNTNVSVQRWEVEAGESWVFTG